MLVDLDGFFFQGRGGTGVTVTGQDAPDAVRTQWRALALSKRNEARIPRLPIHHGENPAQRHFRFQRRLGFEESESVVDAVDVDVNTNGWFVEGNRDHEVRRLSPDSRELTKRLHRIGDPSAELFVDYIGQLF